MFRRIPGANGGTHIRNVSTANDLRAAYERLANRYSVESRPQYASLVVPSGNSSRRLHRWFHVKEAFSWQLLPALLEELELDRRRKLVVIDPFVGSGTTMTSGLEWASSKKREFTGLGVERNPFLGFLAQTRAAAAVSASVNLQKDLGAIVSDVSRALREGTHEDIQLPELTTFSNQTYFNRRRLRNVLRIRDAVKSSSASPLAKDVALIAVASVANGVSNLRRDGRALRFVDRELPGSTRSLFEDEMAILMQDLGGPSLTGQVHIELGDGRAVSEIERHIPSADLVLFSPPYPNNIDYTEVYKLEAWLLGFYRTTEEFMAQRKQTLRSHPSVVFEQGPRLSEPDSVRIAELLAPLISAVPADRYEGQRQRTIKGYFADLLATLRSLHPHVKRSGHVAVVVANSLHGSREEGFVIAADLLIAALGEAAGFEVQTVIEARRVTRRADDPLLRESIVLMRKV